MVELWFGEEFYLGRTAGVGERLQLPAVERFAFGFELCLDRVGEADVHVVAAEEEVFADGDALHGEVAVCVFDGDQAEVGSAAAEVADEHAVTGLDLVFPSAEFLRSPGVERRLRFFEQDDLIAEPGGGGGFEGEFARGFVERGRYGDDN